MNSRFIKQKPRLPRPIVILLCALLVIAAFSLGIFIGKQKAVREIVPDGEGQIINKSSLITSRANDVDFDIFWDVWNLVKEKFYDQPVSDKGMLSGLDDPYSVFLDPEQSGKFLANLNGSFEGIGAEIGIKDEKLQIVAPLKNSPAERAGALPGDWIVLIDGAETSGMSIEEAVTKIRGEKGTRVVLSVSRNGLDSLFELTIIRDTIVIDSVKWEIDENNIMEIDITTFNDDTVPLFNEAVQEALAQNVKGIVLDLRSNPGGLLTAAIDIASAWVGYQPVVIERAKTSAKSFKGATAPRLSDIKTIVLVNNGSASGSEIVAGALQDYDLAELIGVTTFGKGSVQDYRMLKDGSAVKLTIATWYTPKGRSINETGIDPDIEIPFTIENYQNGIDPQKNTAIEVILGTYETEEVD